MNKTENNNKNQQKSQDKVKNALSSGLKSFFTKNLAIKIASLLFAMLLWGYVMTATNPVRTKALSGISVSFDGETDLIAKQLVVCGDHEEILKDISAWVNTEMTKFSNLNANTVTATVSLRSINKPGTYRLQINARAADGGTVIRTEPSEITVEVGNLASRTLPIETEYEGKLPENYWHGAPTLSQTSVIVQGPEADVQQVVKAVCTIPLSELYGTFNQSVVLSLRDSAGNEISNSLFLNTMPSVVVRMDVLKTATLEVDTQSAVLGAEALPANYTLNEVTATPATVRVAGKEELIDSLSTIATETMDISGKKESVKETLPLIIPEGVMVLDEVEAISMYADIREVTEERAFTNIPIEVRGLNRKLSATLSAEQADVTLNGRISLIRPLQRDDVALYVDVSNLTAGQHELEVLLSLPNETMMTEFTRTLSVAKVTVTIR